MVRLAKQEICALLQNVKQYFGETSRVWLFGSRADDSRYGGDIDLYIETDMTSDLIKATLNLRAQLRPILGDQKIDIVTRSRSEQMQAFHLLAKETGVEL